MPKVSAVMDVNGCTHQQVDAVDVQKSYTFLYAQSVYYKLHMWQKIKYVHIPLSVQRSVWYVHKPNIASYIC